MVPGACYRAEVNEQPAVLRQLLSRSRSAVEEVVAAVADYDPQFVLIAARGTSDNAARYAQYVFGAHNALCVGLAVPSLYTIYEAPPSMKRALVLGISQSGESPDVVEVVAEARRQGAVTVAVTNSSSSALASASEHVLDLAAGTERAVAATKTYTAELLVLAMLSAALEGSAKRWDELDQVPVAVDTALSLNADLSALTGRFWDASQFMVVGRGFNFCTAFEIALKLTETCQLVADPFSAADLLHGPVAMVDAGFPVILVSPSGAAFDVVAGVLRRLEMLGAEVIAISDRKELLDRVHGGLAVPPAVPEWLSPIVSVVPGQLFALELAVAKGLDPDRPRGLNKITRTR